MDENAVLYVVEKEVCSSYQDFPKYMLEALKETHAFCLEGFVDVETSIGTFKIFKLSVQRAGGGREGG